MNLTPPAYSSVAAADSQKVRIGMIGPNALPTLPEGAFGPGLGKRLMLSLSWPKCALHHHAPTYQRARDITFDAMNRVGTGIVAMF
jgi:hypothetical protein